MQIVPYLIILAKYTKKKARNILLVGGSRVAEYLMSMLLKADAQVRLIESDPATAEHFAERFPEATDLRGRKQRAGTAGGGRRPDGRGGNAFEPG